MSRERITLNSPSFREFPLRLGRRHGPICMCQLRPQQEPLQTSRLANFQCCCSGRHWFLRDFFYHPVLLSRALSRDVRHHSRPDNCTRSVTDNPEDVGAPARPESLRRPRPPGGPQRCDWQHKSRQRLKFLIEDHLQMLTAHLVSRLRSQDNFGALAKENRGETPKTQRKSEDSEKKNK